VSVFPAPGLQDEIPQIRDENAPLTLPKEVAWFLASYARDAQARIESKSSLPGLASLRAALEQALGFKFTGDEGEHFFRSSLVQTLFYGVFSAWVLWSKRQTTKPKDLFNWHEAAWSLHVPMIKTLFEQLATPSKLQLLGLEEVLNWTETALNRVEREVFFANFEQEHAVQYFYEPFLAAFDPELRKPMGVWFTPPEIVKYMVARIDQVLKNEMGIARRLNVLISVVAPEKSIVRRARATPANTSATAKGRTARAARRLMGFPLSGAVERGHSSPIAEPFGCSVRVGSKLKQSQTLLASVQY
jgi:hypothetical protein